MESIQKYFNSEEAAKILGVNVSTIKRWTDEGKLGCIRTVGGHRKFLMNHLADFIKQNKKPKAKVNVFELDTNEDLDISYNIMKENFDFLKNQLLQYAMNCDRYRTQQVLNGLYLADHPLYFIYDEIITPVLYKIGEMWEREELSVVEEHFATQTIRDSVIRLQMLLRIPSDKTRKALCLNPSSELHDLAMKMVDHILETRGCQVLFSGQITPLVQVQQIFKKFHPDYPYISSTIVEDKSATESEINHLLDLCNQNATKAFIGGRGFNALDIQHPAVVKRLYTFEEVYNSCEV